MSRGNDLTGGRKAIPASAFGGKGTARICAIYGSSKPRTRRERRENKRHFAPELHRGRHFCGARSIIELQILQHALGVDQFGRGAQHRSHVVTGSGSDDHPACMALTGRGLMKRWDGATLQFGGDDVFRVTDAGRAFVAEHSPPPPKLTRSQRRYRRYLDADSSLKFREWLGTSYAKDTAA